MGLQKPKAKAKKPPRVMLPSSKSERGSVTTLEDVHEKLCEIEKDAFSSRGRYRERPYLAAVYQLYRDWRQDKQAKSRAEKMAEICGISLRSDFHPISVLLACSSPGTDEKMRSKWSLALQFAYKKDVSPSDLASFMDANGGMAGCASKFAKLNKASKLQVKKKQKQLVSSKVGLKPPKKAISSNKMQHVSRAGAKHQGEGAHRAKKFATW
jgi:hypothetical protein